MLEAEVVELRQSLADATANRDELRQEMDDLRRDRDHWRKLADQAKLRKQERGPGSAAGLRQALKSDPLTLSEAP
jgi:phage shock protein A